MNTVQTTLWGIFAGLLMAINASAITTFETTVAEIVQNPDKFNQMQVMVQGKAVEIQQRMTPRGSPYTFFFLMDPSSGAKVAVEHMRGKLDLQESALVTVQGDFYKKQTKAGFMNVIRAIFVK